MITLHIPKTAIEMLQYFKMTDNADLVAWAAIPVHKRPYPCPVGSPSQLDIGNLGHAIEAGLVFDAMAISSRIEKTSWDAGILRDHAELMACMRAKFPYRDADDRPDLGPLVSGEE